MTLTMRRKTGKYIVGEILVAYPRPQQATQDSLMRLRPRFDSHFKLLKLGETHVSGFFKQDA
jgi:hypothetical protein